jgi:inosine-uridine nucleoside N-ribohydrolase
MQDSKIPIYLGYGSAPQTPEDFIAAYPFWPTVWGTPGFTNAVSLGQGKGFEKLSFQAEQIHSEKSATQAIEATATKHGETEVMLGLAPYTDLAKSIDKCGKINRIVLMGGYFGKEEDGKIEVSRAGYNTAIDPHASEKILTETKHPVLIFNSQHITNWKFSWAQEEILAILCSKEKNALGEAIAKDLAHYWSVKKPTPYGSLVMADVLTTYVGVLHPELIKSTMPVEFCFNAMTYQNPETHLDEPIHMMHAQAKTLFTVHKKDASNVHIVTELAMDPEILRTQIVGDLAISLFFKDKESFTKAVKEQQQKPLSALEIDHQLLELYPKENSRL